MAVLHDFECKKHGVFEGTHPICPALGCASTDVKMVFLKAPGIMSHGTKQFDRGIKQTATQMNLPNFRSTKGEEPAYGGDLAKKMLWGKEAVQAFNGAGSGNEGIANAAFAADQSTRQWVAEQNSHRLPSQKLKPVADGMRIAATETGITQRPLPPAERIYAREDAANHVKRRG